MQPDNALMQAEAALAVLNRWHAGQHGWVGQESSTLSNLLQAGQQAYDRTTRGGYAAAQTAWRATENYAYAALRSANNELQQTIRALQAASATLARASYNAAEQQAQSTANAVLDGMEDQVNDMFAALWSRIKAVVWTAVPWILLGGGLLLLLAGGLPGWLVGGAALLGGYSMLSTPAYTAPGLSPLAALSI